MQKRATSIAEFFSAKRSDQAEQLDGGRATQESSRSSQDPPAPSEAGSDTADSPERPSCSRRPRTQKSSRTEARQFFDQEARAEGTRDGRSADHDDEDEDGDVESSQDRVFFVADQDVVEESSQSFYRQQDAASLQRDVESVEPYFPLAFAESADRPLAFNFDLFLLDSLSLPRHIVPRDSREEVSNAVLFDNAASAISYCTERLERGWKDTRPAADPTERASRKHTHPKVNKWELFRRHSARLTEALTSGQAPFDANLNRVRLDRFGNIMIWDAPAWSLASPEFTHGFPKRLIVQEHGGFLPGNITVSAKASNLTLRRLAVCDVACLVSQATTAGSGLSRARLLNLRYAAISYQSGSFCPQYLASAMVEFGVNFATFEALSADTLDTLHASLKRGWRQGDDSSGSGEESNEPLISCPESVMQEIGKSSAESSSEAGTSQQPPGDSERTMLCALLARLSSRPGSESSDSEEDHHGETDGENTSTTVGGARAARKKRKTSSVGGRRAKASRVGEATEGREPAGAEAKGEPVTAQEEEEANPWGLQDGSVAGLRLDAFPDAETWQDMLTFFRQHQPLRQEEIRTAMPRGGAWQGDPERAQEATSNLIADARRQLLGEKMAALFVICGRDNCNCREDSCALKGGQYWLQEQPRRPCSQDPRCAVCSLFTRHLDLCNLLGRASTSKGALFSRLLASSVAVHQLYDLAVPADLPPGQRVTRKQTVKGILCSMLDVERNRLQCLRRIGELATLVPKLLCVQLSSGRALFWEQLRRVSNTVIGQRGRAAKLAALEAFRRRMPDDSPWKEFLTPD